MPGASCSVGSAREMTIGSALWYMPIHMCIWAWSCTHTHTHTASMLSWWLFFSLLCPDYPQSNLPALYQLYFDVAWPFVDYLFTPQLHPVRFQKLFLVIQSPTPALPCSPRWAVLKLWASVFLSAEWSCSEIWNWGPFRTVWECQL